MSMNFKLQLTSYLKWPTGSYRYFILPLIFVVTENDVAFVCIRLLAGEPSAVTRRAMQPRVVVLRTERKTEVCERHVNQLLVRGEHVALISVLDL